MKVGIIGLGEVAQLMHLPLLHDMSEQFSIVAVSDVSPSLCAFVAEKYHVSQTYASGEALIDKSNAEIIFVLSPDQYHGVYIRRALEKGKHVFVEKPASLFSAEIKELAELHKQYPAQIVMVGYMRRFSDAFLKAKEILEKSDKKTEYLRFRDIILEGPFFIGQSRQVFYPKDVPQDIIEQGRARRQEHLAQALGKDASDVQRTAYQMLTGLGCHSFSTVRELFGLPRKIRSVATARDGNHLVVVMEYDGFLALYELVNDQDIAQFDATVEIFQHDRKLKFSYETPYIRYQPMSLEVIESTKTDTKTTVYGPSYRDPFKTELAELYACVTEKRQPKTTLNDALEDIRFFESLITKLKNEE